MNHQGPIRDMRKKEKFFVDDKYLNGWAKRCGASATLVYLSLCRHCDSHQQSFPSEKMLARKLGLSKRTIIKSFQILRAYNLISSAYVRHEKTGNILFTVHTLIDKCDWLETPKPEMGGVVQNLHHGGGAKNSTGVVQNLHPKVTHIKDNIKNSQKHPPNPQKQGEPCPPPDEWEKLKESLRRGQ